MAISRRTLLTSAAAVGRTTYRHSETRLDWSRPGLQLIPRKTSSASAESYVTFRTASGA